MRRAAHGRLYPHLKYGGKENFAPQLAGTIRTMKLAIDPQPAARVLIVDDDDGLRTEIADYLGEQDFEVHSARDAESMDAILAERSVDILVLDLMLPGEGGLSICRRVLEAGGPAILMLSAMGEDVDRIVGLELGADDYLAKPCAPRELLARIRAILRRKQGGVGRPPVGVGYRFGGFRLDVPRRHLQAPNGVTVLLTPGEFTLLYAFLERPGQVLTRDQLLDAARGCDTEIFDRAIDVQISRLRRKLCAFTDREIIVTLRGAGYIFSEPIARL
jgi:two-component system OmpR family response regulator